MSDISGTNGNTSLGSTTYVSSSNLDSATLIESAVQQRLAPADRLEVEIAEEESRVAAYEEMQELSNAVASSVASLRNPDDGGEDAFGEKIAFLSSSSGSDPNNLLGVTVEGDAQLASYDLEIVQIAEAHKIASGDMASRDEALGLTGSFTLATEGATAAAIDVSADMSLDEIAAAINAESEDTGVSASVIKVSEGVFQLVLTADDTAKAISVTDNSGNVMQGLGVIQPDGTAANELRPPQSAIVRLDGVEITRDSNEIDDILDGVTFYLYGAEPGTTLQMDVESDLSTAIDDINGFVESYNAYRDFVLRNQEVGAEGEVSEDAILFGDTLLRNLTAQVSSILATGNDSDGISSLADIGITFDANNYLAVDNAALEEALVADLEGVQALFQFQMTASSNEIDVLRNGNGPAQQSFTLDIEVDAEGNAVSASVDGDGSLFTVDGNRLIGAEGTDYDGLVLVFTGDQSTSIDIEISRGLAERLYNSFSAYGNGDDGQIPAAIEAAEDGIEAMEQQVSDIERRAEDYRQRLIEYYAYLENQIAEANRLKDHLNVLFETDD